MATCLFLRKRLCNFYSLQISPGRDSKRCCWNPWTWGSCSEQADPMHPGLVTVHWGPLLFSSDWCAAAVECEAEQAAPLRAWKSLGTAQKRVMLSQWRIHDSAWSLWEIFWHCYPTEMLMLKWQGCCIMKFIALQCIWNLNLNRIPFHLSTWQPSHREEVVFCSNTQEL